VRINYTGDYLYNVPIALPSPGSKQSPNTNSPVGFGLRGRAGGVGPGIEVVGVKSAAAGRAIASSVKKLKGFVKEEELGPYLRCSAKAKRHIRYFKDQVTFCRGVHMNDVLTEHTLVFGSTPVPGLVEGTRRGGDAAGAGGCGSVVGGGEGDAIVSGRGVYYFEVVIGSSAPLQEHYKEVGAHHGADVYVGFSEFSIAGIPGIEDYRSIALWGKNGKVFCNEEELPRVAAHEKLDTELCNATNGPFEIREPMCFSAGDIVGCGIHLQTQRAFFTLNGLFAGWAGYASAQAPSWGHGGTTPEGEWILPSDENLKMFPVVAFKDREDVLSINMATDGFPQRLMAYNTADLPPLPIGPAPEPQFVGDGEAAIGLLETIHSQTLSTSPIVEQFDDDVSAPASHFETDRSIATVIIGLDLGSLSGDRATSVTDEIDTVRGGASSEDLNLRLEGESSSSENSLYDTYDLNNSGTTACAGTDRIYQPNHSTDRIYEPNHSAHFSLQTEEGGGGEGGAAPGSAPGMESNSMEERPVTTGLPVTHSWADTDNDSVSVSVRANGGGGGGGGGGGNVRANSALAGAMRDPLKGGGWGGVWPGGGGGGGDGGGGGVEGVRVCPSTRQGSRASTVGSRPGTGRPGTGRLVMTFTRNWQRCKLLGRGAFG
jgi:hypothetical protein